MDDSEALSANLGRGGWGGECEGGERGRETRGETVVEGGERRKGEERGEGGERVEEVGRRERGEGGRRVSKRGGEG